MNGKSTLRERPQDWGGGYAVLHTEMAVLATGRPGGVWPRAQPDTAGRQTKVLC